MIYFETERLIIRDFIDDDYLFYYNLCINPYTLKYEEDVVPKDIELKENFNKILELKVNDNRKKYSLIVIEKTSNEPIGRMVLWENREDIKEWEIGWFILEEYAGKGYATEAAIVLRDFAFKKLNIHRLQAYCHEHNKASEKVMIKIGMKKEGLLRSCRKLNNKWYGMLVYSIIDTDVDILSQ